jgi:maltose O-acetyltransferase
MAFRNSIRKTGVHLVNLVGNALPPTAAGSRARCVLFRLLGVEIGRDVSLAGGGYIAGGRLEIGDQTFINRECFFDLSAKVTIGKRVSVGPRTVFLTTGHEIGSSRNRAGPLVPREIVIGDGVWIGAHCTILPGVRIGDGVVVAAGSVITRDVPDNALVAGVPAQIKRDLEATPTDTGAP